MEKTIIKQGSEKDYSALLYNDAFYEIKHDQVFYDACRQALKDGVRDLFMAMRDDVIIGHIQLNYQSRFGFFKHQHIPEIQDLNVRRDQRGLGAGRLLIGACEEMARMKGFTHLGLAVGLHHRYGAAQNLYAKMGYIPTGEGVFYDYESIQPLALKPLDDHFVLTMVKKL